MLNSTCSVTWYPWQQYSFEFRESCLSLARKVPSLNKQCGDKTYLLRPSSLSCALKFASLVACWYSAAEHLWIWLSVGVFRRSLSLSEQPWNFACNFTIVVDCLGFCNDFQLEVEVIRVTASAWHITGYDRTRSWSWTLTVYDANVSVSFATEF